MINSSNIHFGAKFINNVPIKKYEPSCNCYMYEPAAFVEFDPKNANDLKAIDSAVVDWRGQFFAEDILKKAILMNQSSLVGDSKIYMLTTQEKNFDKLDGLKILGLAEMEQKPNQPSELVHIQSKPDTTYGSSNRKYKLVGESILNSLKKIYSKSIELTSAYWATNFYEHNGFEMIDPMYFRYRWKG